MTQWIRVLAEQTLGPEFKYPEPISKPRHDHVCLKSQCCGKVGRQEDCWDLLVIRLASGSVRKLVSGEQDGGQ